MHPALRSALVLGLGVVAWTFIMGLTGWYKDPQRLHLFWMVIPWQIGVLVWGLWRTARTSGYLRQVGHGIAASALAGLPIFLGSMLFTKVAFPHYFQELEALGRQLMAQQGLSPEQIEAAVRASAPTQTPAFQAMAGAVGTLVTGLVVSLIVAAFLRARKA